MNEFLKIPIKRSLGWKATHYTRRSNLVPCTWYRLISSGVNTVLYAAGDTTCGMVHKMEDMPSFWLELVKRQVFGQANCSQDLINAYNQIFLLNIEELYEKLENRTVLRLGLIIKKFPF